MQSFYGKSPEEIHTQQCNNRNNRLLRLPHIIGQREVTPERAETNRQSGKSPKSPRPYIEPIIPVSPASWWAGVKSGRYPQPVKLGSRTTCWRESDIEKLCNQSEVIVREG